MTRYEWDDPVDEQDEQRGRAPAPTEGMPLWLMAVWFILAMAVVFCIAYFAQGSFGGL